MLDKAIQHGKEHRQPYRRNKAIDPSCRNHGSDYWCTNGRLHCEKRHTPLPYTTEEIEFDINYKE